MTFLTYYILDLDLYYFLYLDAQPLAQPLWPLAQAPRSASISSWHLISFVCLIDMTQSLS